MFSLGVLARRDAARWPGFDFVALTLCDSAGELPGLDPEVAAAVREALVAREGVVVRWPIDRHATLRVWIQPRRPTLRVHLYEAMDWVSAARRAVGAWNGAVERLRLEVTADSAAADVHVLWARVLRPSGDAKAGESHGKTAGRTALIGSRTSGLLSEAVVTLAEESSVDARTFTPTDIHATTLHEVGQALGLTHLSGVRSVMSPRAGNAGITALDRAVLRAWYRLPARGNTGLAARLNAVARTRERTCAATSGAMAHLAATSGGNSVSQFARCST